jgi:hypothetical protein
MIGLWVVSRQVNIFIHIEGHYISERDLSSFVPLDEYPVDYLGATPCRET